MNRYPEILNRLAEMQASPYYATARADLGNTAQAIRNLGQALATAEADANRWRMMMYISINADSPQTLRMNEMCAAFQDDCSVDEDCRRLAQCLDKLIEEFGAAP